MFVLFVYSTYYDENEFSVWVFLSAFFFNAANMCFLFDLDRKIERYYYNLDLEHVEKEGYFCSLISVERISFLNWKVVAENVPQSQKANECL
jgi:hypothetical protein